MSIRARIALLAFVAILSVIAALFAQYRTIRGEVDALHEQKLAYVQAQTKSGLVHVLQKERGLSAAMLASPSATREAELRKQYAETDAILAQMSATELREKLLVVRQQVGARKTAWAEVRDFYTSHIDDALDAIATGVVAEKSPNTTMHTAIIELALARENMGLLRATINGIYSSGADNLEDVTYLAAEYGKFRHHLRVFQRNLKTLVPVAATDELLAAPYGAVVVQVEEILQRGPKAIWNRSNAQWWADATRVIDNFKATEDRLYDKLFRSADSDIAQKEQELRSYGVSAIGLGLAVALLTAFTILRILRALGVLITTLDDVIRSENYSIRISGESPKDEFGRISLSLNNLLDFTDTLIADKETLASTDLLTGVLNRRSFLEVATREISRADRYETRFALVFIDIDHFKLINDNHGHAAGDEALIHFVHVLRRDLREADLLARWGGEEFVILVPEAGLEQGYQLADKLCAEVSCSFFPGTGRVTCSMGVAERRPGESFEDLCRRADTALYQAKAAGRNRVCRAA
ncbi:MAG: diguanylate cyclase [Sideroxyarcus sp.]|nr:diguanylate cyclase [Sideroxyarcus sp.]